jgi:hypothetical protein
MLKIMGILKYGNLELSLVVFTWKGNLQAS